MHRTSPDFPPAEMPLWWLLFIERNLTREEESWVNIVWWIQWRILRFVDEQNNERVSLNGLLWMILPAALEKEQVRRRKAKTETAEAPQGRVSLVWARYIMIFTRCCKLALSSHLCHFAYLLPDITNLHRETGRGGGRIAGGEEKTGRDVGEDRRQIRILN